MNLKLKRFPSSLLRWFNKKSSSTKIPTHFNKDEKIIRSIFSPINIHNSKGTLLPNSFRTPPEKDEVSVNRLDYTSVDFCKELAKKNEKAGDRYYFGFAVLLKNDIDEANSTIVYSPILAPKSDINPFHSDIKIGYIPQRGEPMPSEYSKKINDLTSKARFYVDPNPNLIGWFGEDINM